MSTIRPIECLQDTNAIAALCRQKDEPVFLTKEGGDGLVIMTTQAYARQFCLLDVYRKLAAAEQQLVDGEPLLNADDVFRRLREKHGR